MFWKKKKPKASQENKIILAMVILPGENTFNSDAFSSEYKTRYGTVIKKTTGDHTTFGFEAQGESVVIAHMPVPQGSNTWKRRSIWMIIICQSICGFILVYQKAKAGIPAILTG